MQETGKRLFWLVPLCSLASVGGSLATMWIFSSVLHFAFDWAIVALLSIVSSAAAISISLR
ncbi:MAG: hypothetical protein U1G07_04670 [Verrucomicrobiota bacterium]